MEKSDNKQGESYYLPEWRTGGQVILGNTRCQIKQLLGSGAIIDAAQATIEETTDPVVIKVLQRRYHPNGVEAVQASSERGVLEILNRSEELSDEKKLPSVPSRLAEITATRGRRFIIANIDGGEVTNGVPYLIQEFAPPEITQFPIEKLDDERRVLEVAFFLSRAMVIAHKAGYAFKDFEIPEKMDRVRVEWQTDADGRLKISNFKIIDWDITGGPEDFTKDLVYFGLCLYYLAGGKTSNFDLLHLPRQNELQLNLSSWENLTAGTQEFLRKLLHPNPEQRYHTAAEIAEDLKIWLSVVDAFASPQANTRDLSRRYSDIAVGLLPPSWVQLGIYKLLLGQKDLPKEWRESCTIWLEKTETCLKKGAYLPMALAISDLRGGFLMQVEKALSLVEKTASEREIVAEARFGLMVVDFGRKFRKFLGSEADFPKLSRKPWWNKLCSAPHNLANGNFATAKRDLEDILAQVTGQSLGLPLDTREPLDKLVDYASAGVMVEGTIKKYHDLARSTKKMTIVEMIAAHQGIIMDFQKAQALAEGEPLIVDSSLIDQVGQTIQEEVQKLESEVRQLQIEWMRKEVEKTVSSQSDSKTQNLQEIALEIDKKIIELGNLQRAGVTGMANITSVLKEKRAMVMTSLERESLVMRGMKQELQVASEQIDSLNEELDRRSKELKAALADKVELEEKQVRAISVLSETTASKLAERRAVYFITGAAAARQKVESVDRTKLEAVLADRLPMIRRIIGKPTVEQIAVQLPVSRELLVAASLEGPGRDLIDEYRKIQSGTDGPAKTEIEKKLLERLFILK